MRILKILYICWIIFFIFAWIISPLIGHNPDILIVIGWIILPPIVVNLWLFLITRIKKYLIRFLLLLLYCPLAILLYLIFD
ncbi:hypothetical protein CXE76_07785 [Campylobacter coli]|nr:hypothetical protein [Campylobacter coli]EAH4461788.1 hypothetical protein [Campylobacter coli]EAH4472774.1 hypothetical protein [Campylobacter coli]EAH5231802.1 hypothetical protein [Campylobacter coli]EAH5244239.1 hypothetical protein [Campylobacter coli]